VKVRANANVLASATRYAARHGITLDGFIEAALLHAMIEKIQPFPSFVCATHGCLMEVNTAATTMACPITEGDEAHAIYPERL
jgi:hypothetical protein